MTRPIVMYRGSRARGGTGRLLAEELGATTVLRRRPLARIPMNAVVFNWGRNRNPEWEVYMAERGITLLNKPENIQLSSNKTATLAAMNDAGVSHLGYATSKVEAQGWLDAGYKVIVRKLTRASQGRGITLIEPGQELPDAPLYTKFYDKTTEYRVHVFNGQVIDYVHKLRMSSEKLEENGISEPDMVVRNHGNGWVFARGDIYQGTEIKQLGIDAIAAVGLDFGAVDILAKFDGDEFLNAVVCETNTAPGLEGTAFNAYATAMREYADEL